MPGATIFTRLHSAAFYQKLHAEAASLLPPGQGKRWLDMGCGPGVLARMAAAKHYAVRAVDRDASMIAAARNWPAPHPLDYAVSNLAAEAAADKRYDIVSASSLLVVLPDAESGLETLKSLLAPGGTLLIIEASPGMTRRKALRLFFSGALGKGGAMLLPWAMARAGHTLPETIFAAPGWNKTPLLHGMAAAWTFPHAAK